MSAQLDAVGVVGLLVANNPDVGLNVSISAAGKVEAQIAVSKDKAATPAVTFLAKIADRYHASLKTERDAVAVGERFGRRVHAVCTVAGWPVEVWTYMYEPDVASAGAAR